MPNALPMTTVCNGIPPKVPNDKRMGSPDRRSVVARKTRPNHWPKTMERGRVGVVSATSQVLGSDSRVMAPAIKVGISTKLDKICSLTSDAIHRALVEASSRAEPWLSSPPARRAKVIRQSSNSAADRAQVGPRRRPAVPMMRAATGF